MLRLRSGSSFQSGCTQLSTETDSKTRYLQQWRSSCSSENGNASCWSKNWYSRAYGPFRSAPLSSSSRRDSDSLNLQNPGRALSLSRVRWDSREGIFTVSPLQVWITWRTLKLRFTQDGWDARNLVMWSLVCWFRKYFVMWFLPLSLHTSTINFDFNLTFSICYKLCV